jgi:hypothetical protein
MKISGVNAFLLGDPWRNWLLVRVDTDETAIHELRMSTSGRTPPISS